MSGAPQRITITVFSDVLCVWACISQARLDEVEKVFGEQVEFDHRFFPVFGDTAHKLGVGWSGKGGFAGFRDHVLESAAPFDHLKINANIWHEVRPVSSTPAHLALKAVQAVAPDRFEAALAAIRSAFFGQARDIARQSVLEEALDAAGVPRDAVEAELASGAAHAALEADLREKDAQRVQGSPTLILDGGRQKLFGNVGYRVIEANIRQLLTEPTAGSASWC